jgi:Uma2 family endonuclease
MAMPAYAPGPWTTDRFFAWTAPEDGNRYELLDGALLVTPAPSFDHQLVATELLVRLRTCAPLAAIAHVLGAPLDVIVNGDTVLEPDIVVVRTRTGERRRATPVVPELLLAVEVLSPSTARHDLGRKRMVLQSAGLAAYWVVDPGARTILAWTGAAEAPAVHDATLTWHPAGAAAPFVLDVAAFFHETLDG